MTELVAKYLETDLAKQRGLKNKSEVAVEGIKLVLERDGVYTRRSRLEHLNMYEDHVKIIDNEIDRIASVYFQKGTAYCDLDESETCIHTDFATSIPDVVKALEAKGLKKR